jgi:hypothetical protein
MSVVPGGERDAEGKHFTVSVEYGYFVTYL